MSQANKVVDVSTGITLSGTRYTKFELREPLLGDIWAAERRCPTDNYNGYRTELLCEVLVAVHSEDGQRFMGPFVASMFKNFRVRDYGVLNKAMMELELAGEPVPGSEQTGLMPS